MNKENETPLSAEENKLPNDSEIRHYWKRKNCFGQYLEGLIDGSIYIRDLASQQTAQKDAEIERLKAKADNIVQASQNLNTSIDTEWNKPVWLRFKETGIKKICLYQKQLFEALNQYQNK